jgi:beta-lactam-binding protein with PASTA domain
VPADTLVGAPPPPVEPLPPPAVGPPPDRRVGAGMLLGIAALVIIAAGIGLAWWLTHRSSNSTANTTTVVVSTAAAAPATPKKVAVPRLVGMQQNAALARLSQLGLAPKLVFQPTKKPKGTVVSQNPAEATMLAKGKSVTLVVDSTPQTKTTSTATTTSTPTTTAAQTTSTPATTSTPSTSTPTTTAAATTPSQPANATMPDVSSQQESAAVQSLGQAGILPSLVWVPGTDELDTVESQAKPAGTTVPYHSHVQINLSTGPGTKPKEQVPNVVGQTLTQALAAIKGAHLRLLYLKYPVTDKSQAGKIVQQSPTGGTAPQNAQILVWMGAYQQ